MVKKGFVRSFLYLNDNFLLLADAENLAAVFRQGG